MRVNSNPFLNNSHDQGDALSPLGSHKLEMPKRWTNLAAMLDIQEPKSFKLHAPRARALPLEPAGAVPSDRCCSPPLHYVRA